MAFGALLGAAIAGAAGQAAGNALGNLVAGNAQNKALEEAIFDIKSGAAYKANLYRQAGSIAMAGAKFSADVYRQSAKISDLVAGSNIAKEQSDLNRAEDALGRQLNDLMSKNYASAAANGTSIASKSIIAVQNEVLNTATTNAIQSRNDSLQRQNAIKFDAALTKMQYENQARASIYSGQIAAMQYENKARATEYDAATEVYKIETGTSSGQASFGEAAGAGAASGLAQGIAMGMML